MKFSTRGYSKVDTVYIHSCIIPTKLHHSHILLLGRKGALRPKKRELFLYLRTTLSALDERAMSIQQLTKY